MKRKNKSAIRQKTAKSCPVTSLTSNVQIVNNFGPVTYILEKQQPEDKRNLFKRLLQVGGSLIRLVLMLLN